MEITLTITEKQARVVMAGLAEMSFSNIQKDGDIALDLWNELTEAVDGHTLNPDEPNEHYSDEPKTIITVKK